MKRLKINIFAIGTMVLLLVSCKKDESKRSELPEGVVTFDLPASIDIVEQSVSVKEVTLLSVEMKAALEGVASSDVHYITFAPDTTKITEYREKYESNALLLPTLNYLYYKPTVAIPAGSNVSEAAVLNVSFQTKLKALSTYVLPLTILSVGGKLQDPGLRRVVYYVFKTGDPVYVDHTGYTLTATASSTTGANAASRVVDGNTATTFWASATTESLPQWVNIDFGREFSFSGLDCFYPTNVNFAATGGNATSVKVETSSDNSTWVDKGIFTVYFNNDARKHTINFPEITTARYLRFTALTAAPYASTYSLVLLSEILMRN